MKKNDIKSLDEALQVHYSEKSLPENKLNKLLSMQVSVIEDKQSVNSLTAMADAQTTNTDTFNKITVN